MRLKARVLQKYQIIAKDMIKLELEALADKMTSPDQYVVFTKTQELKYDKANYGSIGPVSGLRGYSKKAILSVDQDEIKRAKYAHVVKLVSKKVLATGGKIVSEEEAYKVAKKLKYTSQEFKRFCEEPTNFRLRSASLSHWISALIKDKMAEEQTKSIISLGYEVINIYGKDVIFLDPKAYKLVTTYRLDIPKEEKLDKTLTAEEQELLKEYAPDLGDPTGFRRPMPIEKLEGSVKQMSDDDLAWHLLNSKNAMKIGDEDFVRDRLGFKEICLLELMNKNITKKERTQIAEYLLDKAGVSFVGGPTLKKYLVVLAKTGAIDEKIIKAGKDDEMRDAIYYGRITDPDELRKVDYKEYGYQLANNPHTPPDVLEKIAAYDKKKEDDEYSPAEVKWSGSNPRMGGVPGESYTFYFSDTLNNPNYPTEKLIKVFKDYLEKYNKHPAAVTGMVSTLWRREDLPKDFANFLVDYEKKFNAKYMHADPPVCFDEKEFVAYWKKLKADQKDYSHAVVDHPHVPSSILLEALNDKETSTNVKADAYKKLRERGALTDDAVISKVKKDLKFDAPDDLLKQFGLQAFLGAKGEEKLKFTKVSPEELKKLAAEMKAATTHDDFTFDVVAAYTVDRQIHKDYPAKAKEIGNVKHGLYHGTSMANAAGILATGINTKAESRTGAMFGNGFYLASSASKAAQYASDNFSKSGLGVVFKMDVALGKTAEWKYGRPEHDSFMYNRNEDEKKKLAKYAKENGINAYDAPRWHLTHDSVHAKKGLSLQHDEVVVKDGQQINITEIIIVHKEEK